MKWFLSCFNIALILWSFLLCVFFPENLLAEERSVRVLLLPEIETVLSGEIAARIENINVDFGDVFTRGDALIAFDCKTYQSGLDKSRSELVEAVKTHEVNQRLEKFASVSDLEVIVSKSRMDGAKAELSLRETLVDRCIIKAPFSGRVVNRTANPFEYVTPGQPLLEILDSNNLELQLFVDSSWLKWIKKDVVFKVRIDETGKKYSAKVTALGACVDPASQTLEIRGEVDGDHPELLAGMSGTASFKR